MFGLLRLAIALVGTLAAGAWDLKTTDVPDWVVFLMIALGLAIGAAEGFVTGDWVVLAQSLVVATVFTAFSLFMYYAGAWGGGDGALLVAVGVLLPVWPFLTPLDVLPFPLAYFVSIFAVGLVYSTVYLTVSVCRNKRAVAAFRKKFAALSVAYLPIVILLVLLATMLPAILAFILSAVLLMVPPVYALSDAADMLFFRRVPVKSLRPGDMIGEDIPRLKIYKRVIRGLTPKEIIAIRKIKKSVIVRSGVRYGIVFFLALVALLLVSAIL
jgi:hypothetical protein